MNKMPPKDSDESALRGLCHFHSETGTEGGYWAFQDSQYISDGSWSYKGLHLLEDGDYLTIYDKRDLHRMVWSGVIKLTQYASFTQEVFGCWIHADQDGVDRQTWGQWFLEEYPAILVPAHAK